MGGYVTWISIGITGLFGAYQAIIESNPELAMVAGAGATALLGIGRKIEKVISALKQ